jgi:hypothetical protein
MTAPDEPNAAKPETPAARLPGAPVRILAVAALAVAGLVALVIHEASLRASGTEAVLLMQTVDPRAPLSGDYVQLNPSEPLPAGQACPPGTSVSAFGPYAFGARRDPVKWVALAPRGDHHAVVGAAEDRASAARMGPLVVRARVGCWPSGSDQNAVTLRLDADRFYAGHEEAQRLTVMANRQAQQAGAVAVIVSIGADGRARLKGLRIGTQRFDLPPF